MVAGPTLDPWGFFNVAVVDRSEAMGVPVLAFIRHQLAGGLASMDLERFRVDPTGAEVEVAGGWCANPDPAPTIPVSVFWAWVIDDLFFRGVSSLVVLARDFDGWPVQFRRVLPGQLTYDPITLAWGLTAAMPVYYRGQQIDPADVIVINGPHEGLLNYAGPIIRAAVDLEQAGANAAATPTPSIELHQTTGEPLTPDDATELVDRYASARRRSSVAYTPANIETKANGFSAADQQLVEGRQYMATQLARHAGVNPVLVGAAMGSSSSYVYTNQADYRQAFLDDVLDSYLRAIEGRLSANDVTPRGQYLRFDRDAYTHLTQMQRAQIMVGALKSQADPERVDQIARSIGVDPTAGDTVDSPPVDRTPPPPPQRQGATA